MIFKSYITFPRSGLRSKLLRHPTVSVNLSFPDFSGFLFILFFLFFLFFSSCSSCSFFAFLPVLLVPVRNIVKVESKRAERGKGEGEMRAEIERAEREKGEGEIKGTKQWEYGIY